MNSREQLIDNALSHLRIARDLLKVADAPKATDKVRHAMKSAEGAERHARLERYRQMRHS
jgi:hypothetical protein